MESKKLWLCLCFPNLAVEVFTRDRTKEAVLITEKKIVVFLNQEARNLGLKPGISVAEALTIDESINFFERNKSREIEKLSQIAQWLYRFTPNVSIKKPKSVLLELSGSLKLFGGLKKIQQKILKSLEEKGLSVQVGVNMSPLSAQCFSEANAGKNLKDIKTSISSIPIHILEVDQKIVGSLHKMGVYNCGQLFRLPLSDLSHRFGGQFTLYLKKLIGTIPDPQIFIENKPYFKSDITLIPEISDKNSLIFPMRRLIGELNEFLDARKLLTDSLLFKISHRNYKPKTLSVLLAKPEKDLRIFLMLAKLKLEKTDLMPEIDNICLLSERFSKSKNDSGDLFHETQFRQKDGYFPSKTEEKWRVQLINMMTAKLGPDSCYTLSTVSDHRPELSWSKEQPGQTNNPIKPSKQMDSDKEENPRPLLLLKAPKRIPEKNRSPDSLETLKILRGPERIDVGWWDNHPVARDYFIARDSSGALYWIYYDLSSDKWYLHGIFS